MAAGATLFDPGLKELNSFTLSTTALDEVLFDHWFKPSFQTRRCHKSDDGRAGNGAPDHHFSREARGGDALAGRTRVHRKQLVALARKGPQRGDRVQVIPGLGAGNRILRHLSLGTGGEQRRDPILRRRYARALHRLNADAEAASLIGEALKADWDGELVRLYGELLGSDGLSRLAAIEQWLGEYGEREELLVTAGRACLQNKLWGKARSYLEAAVRLKPTPAAYRELARLCEQTQNPEEAARYYRLGLELAAP